MSPTFIVDCSITMSWCFSDEQTPATHAVQDRLEREAALVPAHWFLEVANVLAMSEKRKRMTTSESGQFLALLAAVEIHVDNETPRRSFSEILPLCRSYGLTAYDAAYLELACRRALPLATLDQDLRAAASKAGVRLMGK